MSRYRDVRMASKRDRGVRLRHVLAAGQGAAREAATARRARRHTPLSMAAFLAGQRRDRAWYGMPPRMYAALANARCGGMTDPRAIVGAESAFGTRLTATAFRLVRAPRRRAAPTASATPA